jgi:Arc/MetJ family transcription regulator
VLVAYSRVTPIDGLSICCWVDILAVVTKRLIDVDDDKLEAVKELLGSSTLKGTVDAALDEVLALDRRRRALLESRGVDPGELADPAARRAAWG